MIFQPESAESESESDRHWGVDTLVKSSKTLGSHHMETYRP